MRDIRDILNESEVVFNVAISVSFNSPYVYYIFRNNYEQVEIDISIRTVSHQLTFSEIGFIEENYPLWKIGGFLIRKKIYR